jgi:uncharacterized protein (DUF58 family)
MEYRLTSDKSIITVKAFIIFLFSFLAFLGALYIYFLDPRYVSITAEKTVTINKGSEITIPVTIKNRTRIHFSQLEKYYLSGRIKKLGSNDREVDLPRTVIDLPPWGQTNSVLYLVSPVEEGEYQIDIGIVKEGEYWLSNRGERPFKMHLTVKGQE